MSPRPFDSSRTLADPKALGVLRQVAGQLRVAGYDNRPMEGAGPGPLALSRLALGHPVACSDLRIDGVEALGHSGAADLDGGGLYLVPRFTLFCLDETIVLVPRDAGHDPERAYFGRDSLLLAELAAQFAVPGGAMADLGTGAGTVAALLARRVRTVVATDILPRTVACAAITFALNTGAWGGPARALVADVAAGLAPGRFALVTANPPWVPDLDRAEEGPARVYAEGGPRGFELPRRFLVEGAHLLAPGGVMVVLALDTVWDDGDRPLAALANGLRRLGFDVHLQVTGLSGSWKTGRYNFLSRFPTICSAEHVVVTVRRPASAPPLPAQAASSSDSTYLNMGPNSRWATSSA